MLERVCVYMRGCVAGSDVKEVTARQPLCAVMCLPFFAFVYLNHF